LILSAFGCLGVSRVLGWVAMAGQRVSVSVNADDLKWLRRRAKRRGSNLSAVFAEATALLRQREARERLLERSVSSHEADAIRAEWWSRGPGT
jgi:hypothetical protein